MTQLYRISPLYRCGNWGTEMSGTQEVWCWSVSLSPSSSNQLSGTERGQNCHRWSELHFHLRITSDSRGSSPVLWMSPACFPFSFQIQCYAPTSPLPKYTYCILSICYKRSTQWGRMTPKLTAKIIYYCWVSEDSNLWNRFIWLRIQHFLNSLLGTKYTVGSEQSISGFSLKHSLSTHQGRILRVWLLCLSLPSDGLLWNLPYFLKMKRITSRQQFQMLTGIHSWTDSVTEGWSGDDTKKIEEEVKGRHRQEIEIFTWNIILSQLPVKPWHSRETSPDLLETGKRKELVRL